MPALFKPSWALNVAAYAGQCLLGCLTCLKASSSAIADCSLVSFCRPPALLFARFAALGILGIVGLALLAFLTRLCACVCVWLWGVFVHRIPHSLCAFSHRCCGAYAGATTRICGGLMNLFMSGHEFASCHAFSFYLLRRSSKRGRRYATLVRSAYGTRLSRVCVLRHQVSPSWA